MNWLEIMMLIFGAGAFAGSFLIRGKAEEEQGQEVDLDLIRSVIQKEMDDAKDRVVEVVDETLEYAVEKTERASERISNEKIMAISEYSETVLEDINKSHQEVMFLYDMLNDKHNNLKETVKHVDKTAKEAEEAANAAALALAAKAREESEAKVREQEAQRQEEKKSATQISAVQISAQEKEDARRQMARLILPVQQELPMHTAANFGQPNMNTAIPFQSAAFNPMAYNPMSPAAVKPVAAAKPAAKQQKENQQGELRPLMVRSVEIVSADIVTTKDMKPVTDHSNASQVSAVDLQAFGARPENMTVVDVKPADLRPVEVYSFVDQAPHIERPVKKGKQAASLENMVNKKRQQDSASNKTLAEETQENNNDKILKLYKEGISDVDIAKKLGLGVGEVKLVINLFKGGV